MFRIKLRGIIEVGFALAGKTNPRMMTGCYPT